MNIDKIRELLRLRRAVLRIRVVSLNVAEEWERVKTNRNQMLGYNGETEWRRRAKGRYHINALMTDSDQNNFYENCR